MIVTSTPDDEPCKPSDIKVHTDGNLADEPPPSYTSQTDPDDPSILASGSTSTSTDTRTFKSKPTNFLSLSNNHDSIRGEFIIDPSMEIPPAMLASLDDTETEDDRKNLQLRSKSGSVHADIWLLGSQRDTDKARRTTIVLASNHGSVHAQVQTLDGAAPFSLTATTSHGGVRLAIPRSFRGLLSLSTRHGSVTISDPIVWNATRLSQVDLTRRYFVGDFSLLGEDEWRGDEVVVDAPLGSIRVRYVDEVVETKGRKGLFSWLFKK